MIEPKLNDPRYSMFSYIFRTDTNSYDINDILEEYEEWRYILTHFLGMQEYFEIGEASISTRLTSCLAKTGRNRGQKYGFITVNGNYIKYHSNPDNLHATLAHETIHTMVGCFNHGPNFIRACAHVMDLYKGVTISRTRSDLGYDKWLNSQLSPNSVSHAKKYKIVCSYCGQTMYRERLSKIVKTPDSFRCGICHNKFKVFEIKPDGIEVERVFVRL